MRVVFVSSPPSRAPYPLPEPLPSPPAADRQQARRQAVQRHCRGRVGVRRDAVRHAGGHVPVRPYGAPQPQQLGGARGGAGGGAGGRMLGGMLGKQRDGINSGAVHEVYSWSGGVCSCRNLGATALLGVGTGVRSSRDHRTRLCAMPILAPRLGCECRRRDLSPHAACSLRAACLPA